MTRWLGDDSPTPYLRNLRAQQSGFHIGEQAVHLDDWWGETVELDFHFYRPGEMDGYLAEAGFVDIEVIERDPYPEVEHPSRQAYLFAHNPQIALTSQWKCDKHDGRGAILRSV